MPVEPCLIQEPGFQAWLWDEEPYDLELVRNFLSWASIYRSEKKKSFLHLIHMNGQHIARPGGHRNEDHSLIPSRSSGSGGVRQKAGPS